MDELSRWMKYRLARKHVFNMEDIYTLQYLCPLDTGRGWEPLMKPYLRALSASCICFFHFRFKFLTGRSGWMKTFHFSSTCYEYSSTLLRFIRLRSSSTTNLSCMWCIGWTPQLGVRRMHGVSSSPSSHKPHPTNLIQTSKVHPRLRLHMNRIERLITLFCFQRVDELHILEALKADVKLKSSIIHPPPQAFCLSPHLHRLLPRSLGDLITQRGFQLRTSHHITSHLSVCSNRTYDPIHFPNIAESPMLLVPSWFQFFSLFFCSLFRALWWPNGGARVCNTQMADECGIARCVCEQLSGGGIRVCDVR